MSCILALDTSTSKAFVALGKCEDDNLLACEEEVSGEESNHHESIANLVSQVCERTQVTTKDISLLLMGSGPGSFTGLRIGYGFGKGMAYGLKIPFWVENTFNAMAHEFDQRGRLFVVIEDARRDEIFCSISLRGEGTVFPTPTIMQTKDLLEKIKILQDKFHILKEEVVFISSDIKFSEKIGKSVYKPTHLGCSLIRLCLLHKKAAKNVSFTVNQISSIEPLYVRDVNAKTIEERKIGLCNS